MKKVFKHITKKHRLASILSICLCVLLMLPIFCQTISASVNKKTLRVGYFDYSGFIEERGGKFYGYGVSYLDEISKYTGYNFEYVYDSWDNLLKRIENHEIDLLCTMQKTPERVEKYEFCSISSGLETASLCVSPQSGMLYNDYASFNGMKIAFLQDSYQNVMFDKFAKLHDFTYTPVHYKFMSEMESAVDMGDVDGYVSGSLQSTENYRVVADFSLDPFYFSTYKGNIELISQFDDAMCQILNNKPSFNVDLKKLHYGPISDVGIVYTREESEYIKAHPTLRIAFNRFDNAGNATDFKGYMFDTLKLISQKSGITFEYLAYNSVGECFDAVNKGAADMAADVYNSSEFAANNQMQITDPYYSNPLVLIGLSNQAANTQGKYRVALLKSDVGSRIFTEKNFPDYSIKYYDSMDACYDAMVSGEADLVMQKFEETPAYFAKHKNPNLLIFSTSPAPYDTCLGISKSQPLALVSVINKSIRNISNNELEYISVSNNAAISELSFEEVLRRNSVQILMGFVFIVAIILVLLFRSRRKHTSELLRIAYTDTLTNGDNIARFQLRAEKLLSSAKDVSYDFCVLDINKFKSINEMYGYDTGDDIIKTIYKILQSCVYQNELLARDTADRFVMLLEDNDAHFLSKRLNHIMTMVTNLSASELKKSVFKLIVSCGVCHVKEFDLPVASYIDHAYLAARTLKNSHRNNFAVYDIGMLETLNHEKELENIMDEAIHSHEFKVYLQPKVDLKTQKVMGSEALVRWQLADGTMVQPDSFIPVFEKNGFIESLDFYMLTSVCAILREKLNKGITCLPVSINQSRFLFYQKDYLNNVLAIIDGYKIPPHLIELEITESLFIDATEDFASILTNLRAHGIHISLDDFGSGYSSLNMLRNIPLDIIKIDRDFLRVADDSNTNKILIRKIVELAKELNIRVICEGVETEEQMHFLESVGCDYAQGFYYSRPIPSAEFYKFVCDFNEEDEIL